ncbi:UDP-glycosyltransferase 83A1-like [Momordica charantia]|uniref:UDP-glycosyltransferase 83A1-like n=1 Tax=Momordica charantia TaxID=3673 RepID=A0A6J1BWK1_MOMCH|nr:UDP-glycosyltransferase 83A1-like [Momordica charantia]
MGNPHIVSVPFPSQGHVNPVMHISQKLAKNGVTVTVVNADFIHTKVVASLGDFKDTILSSHLQLVSLPDGFGPDENRYSVDKLFYRLMAALRSQLRQLLSQFDKHNACVLVDLNMAWVLELAHDLGIRGVVFSSFSAAYCAINFSIPKFIQDGIIDAQGVPMKQQKVQLRPGMPLMDTVDLPWRCLGYEEADTKKVFEYLVEQGRGFELAEWYLFNTAYDLEPEAVSLSPKILSVGPLAASQAGQFWKEDDSCLAWLDQHPPKSVLFLGL